MTTFSHSKIGSFETCPLKYKYAYIDKIKPEQEDTVETFLGSLVHEALEKLYKDLKFEKSLTLKELTDYFNKQWEENWNSTIKINKKEYTKENYRKMGVRYLTDYYNRYQPFNQGKVIGLETTDILDIGEGYRFHIRIDRLVDMGNGLYEVHDYKTNNTLPKQQYLDEDRQLAMYSLWAKLNFKDCKKIRLVWHFLAFDREMESFRTTEQLNELKKSVIAQIKEIEKTKDFKPNESALCPYCEYQNICPLWGHELKLKEKSPNEFLKDTGVKLVNEYVKTQDELKEFREKIDVKLQKLQEALIEFCRKNRVDVIVGSDKKITVKEKESVYFPDKGTPEREKLIELLKTLKKYNELVDFNVNMLKKAVTDRIWPEEILKKLEKFEEKDTSYILSVKKR